MLHATLMSAACALLGLAAATPVAQAASGDVVVPAHRTKDGSYVPANVPPSSGGTHLARRPGKRSVAHVAAARSEPNAIAVPLFAQARNVRR